MLPTWISAALALASLASSVLGQQYGAAELIPQGLMPRYGAAAPPLPVARRDGPPCNPGSHLCNDVGFSNQCCPDTQYCYVKPDNTPWCCDIGSNCDSNCNATAFQCPTTVTVSGTTTTSPACCPRKCTSTSQFLCVSSLGGNCCNYGATCAVGGQCVATATTTLASGLIPAGTQSCTATTQHACTDGAPGCCDDSSLCTLVGGAAYCAAMNTPVSVVPVEPQGGLSDGAKAGIGAGIAVGACIVIGAITWMCIRKRRERERTESGRSPDDAMTEVTNDTRPQPLRGLTQDYFGPNAVAGPFTDTNATSAATTAGRQRGVPTQPHAPDDIAAPVEIDSRMKPTNDDESTAPIMGLGTTPETTEGRFELYGSDMASSSPPVVTPGSARSGTDGVQVTPMP